ncbi:hypothetical protein MTR67_052001 [Solanum verrucosum]|uniref:Uncharacterized protein n=1 Tax=Solanum verrucosum TaxID=315347 RepID=A0AAF0V8K1_SOLVR|nr:hypothetical protein MTR67_052001 [Solanum verrucosum]
MPALSLLLLVFLIEFSWSSLELCTDTIDLFESLCSVRSFVYVYFNIFFLFCVLPHNIVTR